MDYFFEQMKAILGNRYEAFKAAYDGKPRHKALRVNTSKISTEAFVALCDKYERAGVREYGLRHNRLCAQSFYTVVKPSLDPLYHAGLYYMQEPSASAAVAAFAPYIGTRVLDLCAAPGGKSTQAAAFMNGGVIFANDVDYTRARALEENIERLGVTNAVVTCRTAGDYRAAGLDGYFDTLIVDAPCSGGGMMRYEDVPYTAEIVAGCAKRQREILDDAVELLAGGGHMLYSTCTFAPEEDEENVRYIMSKGFESVDVPLLPGAERGIDLPEARRIYPHNFDGEGHFYCVLKKKDGEKSALRAEKRGKTKTVNVGALGLTAEERDGELYLPLPELPSIASDAMHTKTHMTRRAGVPVYDRNCVVGKPRELSHALSHALTAAQVRAVGIAELGADAEKYIRGEQVSTNLPRGIYIAAVDGYALGFTRCAPDGSGERVLKNLYPKRLRVRA